MEPLLYCLLALSVLSVVLSLLAVVTARSGRRDNERELRRQLDQLESELTAAIRQHPELSGELHSVLARAREKVLTDGEDQP